jgi:hypothetical protein
MAKVSSLRCSPRTLVLGEKEAHWGQDPAWRAGSSRVRRNICRHIWPKISALLTSRSYLSPSLRAHFVTRQAYLPIDISFGHVSNELNKCSPQRTYPSLRLAQTWASRTRATSLKHFLVLWERCQKSGERIVGAKRRPHPATRRE